MAKKWTQAELRAVVAQRSTPEHRFVDSVLSRRESGTSRQMTTAEIAALYCAKHRAWKCGEAH